MSSCHPARHEAEHINSIQTANIADSNGLGVAIFAILSKKKDPANDFFDFDRHSFSSKSLASHLHLGSNLIVRRPMEPPT